jgi:hypothetical protein
MSRAIATTAGPFGRRRPHCWRAAIVIVLAAGTAIVVVGLREHGRALAQEAPPGARQPEPKPIPFFPRVGRYEIVWTNLAYFYFARDGRAVLRFPGHPPLVVQPGEAEGVRKFAQRNLPSSELPQAIGRDGRYSINVSQVLYWENTAGGATAHFSNCPSLDLTAEEAAQLRDEANHMLGWQLPAQEAPPGARQPEPGPAPLPRVGRYEIVWTNPAYFYFARDGRAVLQFPGHPPLVVQPGEAEGVRKFAQRNLPSSELWRRIGRNYRIIGWPRAIGRDGRYSINASQVLYWENIADGATAHFSNCPSLDLTAEEAAQLRDVANRMQERELPAPGVAPPVPQLPAPGVAPPVPQLPAPVMAPPFPRIGRAEILWMNLAYFYFARDGRAVLQFPGHPPSSSNRGKPRGSANSRSRRRRLAYCRERSAATGGTPSMCRRSCIGRTPPAGPPRTSRIVRPST